MSKTQHGGQRPNAGRKPAPYPTQLLKIRAMKEELEQILQLTTRERAAILLKAIQQDKKNETI